MALRAPTLEKHYAVAVANSPLFRLGGEVRNIIWRCALHLNLDDIEYISYGFGKDGTREVQAALLFICHLIQQETAAIFYLENEYDINCTGFNSESLMALTRRFKTLNLSLSTMLQEHPNAVHVEADPVSWSGLMLWLERYHNGSVGVPNGPTFDPSSGFDTESSVMKAMFEMVYDLRHIEWGVVEAVLDRQRPILVGCYADWAKN
ncbi:hypothetical protein B0A48_11167 [Cryoendolithus antarcticus]|uniref:Uncharacterized protein n=1 Tax=Cryoendolithus antarcticus TaxID=1507870 RepID=A0A1V8SV10_9PEZI|nr:hypothetical protein B0A48_11167 [Cryoendolithus antarcticus]